MPPDQRPYFVTRACPEGEHELVDRDGERACRVCQFTAISLRDVIGHDVS